MTHPKRNLIYSTVLMLAVAACASSNYDTSSSEDALSPETTRVAVTEQDFTRSDQFLSGTPEKSLLNGDIQYQWLNGGAALSYRYQSENGTEYRRVDTETGLIEPLFDHSRLAGALTDAVSLDVSPGNLLIDKILSVSNDAISVLISGEPVSCLLIEYTCSSLAVGKSEAPPTSNGLGNPSPNGRYTLYSENHNLVLKRSDSNERVSVTQDGEEHWAYGAIPESSTSAITIRRTGITLPPSAIWSPDGTKFVSYKLDERFVPELDLIENVPADGSFRPQLHSYRMNFPGDPEATAEYFIYDVETNIRTPIAYPALSGTFGTPSQRGHVFWDQAGEALYLVDGSEMQSDMSLVRIDPETGGADTLIRDTSSMHVVQSQSVAGVPNTTILSNGDIIWYSERSNWGHLYLYDQDGELKHAITSGEWLVHEVLHVDETEGWVYFTARGQDPSNPYHRKLSKAAIDGTGVVELTPGPGDHNLTRIAPRSSELVSVSAMMTGATQRSSFAPDGMHFVDQSGSLANPGSWVLRTSDGQRVADLATIDPSPLPPFTAPEPFTVKSADGVWDLHGVLLKPADFDPTETYPVIDNIYPGPQSNRLPTAFAWGGGGRAGVIFGEAQALADLGFIVMLFDGRGTPNRSREFRELAFGNMQKAGFLEDHISALQQLSKTRPFLDLDRVGIFGTSGGGFATATALIKHADFFKVGVSSAGNHEQRSYIALWGIGFNGPIEGLDYDEVFAGTDVSEFQGKLLLAHGDLDDNVHPANTARIADALIEGNKSFDMLIMPNVNHSISFVPYFRRATQRYFIEHLMGADLPAGADMTPVGDSSVQGDSTN